MSSDERKRQPTGNYEVGFCRPPLHTRYAKGHSGNTRGRPKGTRNLKTDLMAELAESITVREGDRRFKLSKQRVVVKALLAKAMKGDARAISILLGLIVRLVDLETSHGVDAPLAAEDAALLEYLRERHKGGAENPPAESKHDQAKDREP